MKLQLVLRSFAAASCGMHLERGVTASMLILLFFRLLLALELSLSLSQCFMGFFRDLSP